MSLPIDRRILTERSGSRQFSPSSPPLGLPREAFHDGSRVSDQRHNHPDHHGHWRADRNGSATVCGPAMDARQTRREPRTDGIVVCLELAAGIGRGDGCPVPSAGRPACTVRMAGCGSTIVVGIVVLDFSVGYASHRTMHAWPAMWRFHRVHHSDAFVDVTTTYRTHPVETAWRFLFAIVPVWLLGIPAQAVIDPAAAAGDQRRDRARKHPALAAARPCPVVGLGDAERPQDPPFARRLGNQLELRESSDDLRPCCSGRTRLRLMPSPWSMDSTTPGG